MPFGPLEIIVVLVIILIIFGPKRLPELGRSMGRGMREFKESVTGKDKDPDEEERPELTQAAAEEAPAPTAPAAGEAEKVEAKPAGDAS